VTWTIDVDADDEVVAAREAQRYHRRVVRRWVFEVTDKEGRSVIVDLDADTEEKRGRHPRLPARPSSTRTDGMRDVRGRAACVPSEPAGVVGGPRPRADLVLVGAWHRPDPGSEEARKTGDSNDQQRFEVVYRGKIYLGVRSKVHAPDLEATDCGESTVSEDEFQLSQTWTFGSTSSIRSGPAVHCFRCFTNWASHRSSILSNRKELAMRTCLLKAVLGLSASVLIVLATNVARAADPTTGDYFNLLNVDEGQNKCVGLWGKVPNTGAMAIGWQCKSVTAAEDQAWYFDTTDCITVTAEDTGATSQYCSIRNGLNPSKCLGIDGGSRREGAYAKVWDCGGPAHPDQYWLPSVVAYFGEYILWNYNQSFMGLGVVGYSNISGYESPLYGLTTDPTIFWASYVHP
jgi:hypothetical protein